MNQEPRPQGLPPCLSLNYCQHLYNPIHDTTLLLAQCEERYPRWQFKLDLGGVINERAGTLIAEGYRECLTFKAESHPSHYSKIWVRKREDLMPNTSLSEAKRTNHAQGRGMARLRAERLVTG